MGCQSEAGSPDRLVAVNVKLAARLSRLRNLLNHLSSLSRVFHPRSDIRLRDYSHQLPVVVYDRNSAYLMLFHQANRLVGIVIDPTGDDVPGHNLTDSRVMGIAIFGHNF